MNTQRPGADMPRHYTPEDRKVAGDMLGDVRTLDLLDCHIHISGGPDAPAVALWLDPQLGNDVPHLGPVIAPGGVGPQFYRLVLACAEDALARGHAQGSFLIKNAALLKHLQSTFRFRAQPCGWEPGTGEPRQWFVRVDLPDAIDQLRAVIVALDEEAR